MTRRRTSTVLVAAAALLAGLIAPVTAHAAPSTPGSAARAAASKPVPLTTASRLRSNGFGSVRAGMTVGQAEAATGQVFAPTELDLFGRQCYFAAPRGSRLGVQFFVQSETPVKSYRDGIIATAVTYRRTVPTGEGLRVGDRAARVRSLYPAATRTPPATGSEGDLLARGAKGFALRFDVVAGRVAGIHAGDDQAVLSYEGCA